MTEVSSQPKTTQPFPQFHKLIIDPVVNATRSCIKWITPNLLEPTPKFRPDETNDYEEFQIYLDTWLTSINEPLREFSSEIPDWFDPEKFARGRSFAMKHLLGLLYAEQLSVVLLMSLPMLRRPLIFSGKSDSAEKAFQRYLSTVERVMTWYSQDIWDKDSTAHHNLLSFWKMKYALGFLLQNFSFRQRSHISCTTFFLGFRAYPLGTSLFIGNRTHMCTLSCLPSGVGCQWRTSIKPIAVVAEINKPPPSTLKSSQAKVVRGMHNQIERTMKSCSAAKRNSKLQQYETSGPSTPLLDSLKADLKPYLPNTQQQKWLQSFQTSENGLFINQLGMACTQMGFVGLIILEPGKFGASRASEADLDDFVYVWYVLGHQLGIEDRFNLCIGGLEETRWRCKQLIRNVVLPSLALAGSDWEHMSQCVIEGVDRILRQTSFEASLAYTLWALNVQTLHIQRLINWRELSRLWLFKSVLCTLLSIPGFPDIFGALLRIRLNRLRSQLVTLERTGTVEPFKTEARQLIT